MKATHRKTALTGLATVLIIVLMFLPSTQAQTNATFTPADRFSIPTLHGSISFSVNGSCSSAMLENGTWIFEDLRLNNSEPLGTLKISAENSNVTVYSYMANYFFGRGAILNYTAEGQGKQTMNLGLNTSQPTSPEEWFVMVPGSAFLAEGNGWDLLPDNSVIVTGATGNVFLAHFNYDIPRSSGPFWEQHLIALLTAAVVVVIVAVALVIRVKGRT